MQRWFDLKKTLVLSTVIWFICSQPVLADVISLPRDYPEKVLSRAEAVYRIVQTMDLKKQNAGFISYCLNTPSECFFTFAAMSDFDDIGFNPLILYPDIKQESYYYDAINTASMLGLVHGFISVEDSPFMPEQAMTRIQALKVVMGGANLLTWKEKFELNEDDYVSVYSDIDPKIPEMWWYMRYAKFAKDAGITANEAYFRPDEPIRLSELSDMIGKTMKYKDDQQVNP